MDIGRMLGRGSSSGSSSDGKERAKEGRLEQVKGRKSLATLATQADKRVLKNIKVNETRKKKREEEQTRRRRISGDKVEEAENVAPVEGKKNDRREKLEEFVKQKRLLEEAKRKGAKPVFRPGGKVQGQQGGLGNTSPFGNSTLSTTRMCSGTMRRGASPTNLTRGTSSTNLARGASFAPENTQFVFTLARPGQAASTPKVLAGPGGSTRANQGKAKVPLIEVQPGSPSASSQSSTSSTSSQRASTLAPPGQAASTPKEEEAMKTPRGRRRSPGVSPETTLSSLECVKDRSASCDRRRPVRYSSTSATPSPSATPSRRFTKRNIAQALE